MAVISYAPLSLEDRVRRRRVLFQDYGKKRYKTRPPAKVESTDEPVMAVAKGCCAKCGVHIGRGVKFHEKRCTGAGEG